MADETDRKVVRATPSENADEAAARVAAYAAERVLLMRPGDALHIHRGEDGPDMFRIRQEHEYPLAGGAS